MTRRPELIVFDVNETLLSLEPIRENLKRLFSPEAPVGEWFARMLHASLVANTLGQYRSFGEIGVAALVDMSVRRGEPVSARDAAEALAPMRKLPPHDDVVEGVRRLAGAGFRMVALTNGSTEAANAQIENAGLAESLERVISVDEVGRFKPDPAPYRHTAEVTGVEMSDMVLVAAHDWDCAGAMAAGAGAVFVERPGAVWGLPTPSPDLRVPDITALADALGA